MTRRASLLDLDPDLGEGLEPRRQELARQQLIVRVEGVQAGEWRPEANAFGVQGGVGLLLVEGLAVRRVALAHRAAAELLGPGDLLRPWQDDGEHAVYPFSATWRVVQPLSLAVLDRPFAARLAPLPELVSALVGRALDRALRVVGHLVVAQLTSVDNRLLVALWHLADRWGRVRPDGVVLPLALTHEMLGLIVGARRPSVTAALGRLAERELIAPQRGGGWLLHGDPPKELGPLRGRASGARE